MFRYHPILQALLSRNQPIVFPSQGARFCNRLDRLGESQRWVMVLPLSKC